jgi:hypothetical protein
MTSSRSVPDSSAVEIDRPASRQALPRRACSYSRALRTATPAATASVSSTSSSSSVKALPSSLPVR